jgi:hypothetical protein
MAGSGSAGSAHRIGWVLAARDLNFNSARFRKPRRPFHRRNESMGKSTLFALNAETLSHLDSGRASAALDQALKKAVLDCLDRPGDDRPRKITLCLEVKPVMEVINQTISWEGGCVAWSGKVTYEQGTGTRGLHGCQQESI